jgi:hypothetical protein
LSSDQPQTLFPRPACLRKAEVENPPTPRYLLTHNPTTITSPIYISPGTAVVGSGTAWHVTNLSTIHAGNIGIGIYLSAGGNITNGAPRRTGASIAGGAGGVYIIGAPGTVTNFGKVSSPGAGIFLASGGLIVNGAASVTRASIVGGERTRHHYRRQGRQGNKFRQHHRT